MEHKEFKCNNRNPECRAYHGYGYYTKGGTKVFENDALKNKILVTSGQTAFAIDYLVEVAAAIEINSDSFEGLAQQQASNCNRKQEN